MSPQPKAQWGCIHSAEWSPYSPLTRRHCSRQTLGCIGATARRSFIESGQDGRDSGASAHASVSVMQQNLHDQQPLYSQSLGRDTFSNVCEKRGLFRSLKGEKHYSDSKLSDIYAELLWPKISQQTVLS